MYNKEITLSVSLGISVPNSSCFRGQFGLILDEDNKIWYSDNDKEYQMKRIPMFRMVLFAKGDNYKAKSINLCPTKLQYVNKIHRVFFESDEPLTSLLDIPYKEINNSSLNYEELAYYNFGHYKLYSITAIHYLAKDSTDLGSRFFLKDDRNMQYTEISNALVGLLDKGYYGGENIKYPIDGKSIQSICSLVENFNPYEVFESYKVEIEHKHVSRVGRDDHFFEYKSYSIKYIDEYLKRWFSEKKIQLAFDSGYSSYFSPTIPYKRFYSEENDAKVRAYKEYSKLEHLDCLLKRQLLTMMP